MTLHLYRRHRRDCKSGQGEDSVTSEFDERRKGWKRCECPITVSGTLNGKYRRQSTGKWEWEPAKLVAASWEIGGSWSGPIPQPPQPEREARDQEPTAITDATEAFLAKCQNRGIRPNTLSKYRTFTNQIRAYAIDRGYINLDQLTVSDLDRFYASWKDGIRAKAKKLERLKSFIKFCMKRKWISENIAEDLEAPEGSSVPNHKSPFTDEELQRLHTACDKLGPAPGRPRRNWSGEDARDFIYLSIYTGMRISDVATFDITKRLDGNNVFLRMHKTNKPLFTWIPDWLVARLKARQEQYGSLIFKAGVTLNMKQLSDIWRNKRLKVVFDLAGPWTEKPHPHRFRHTFVRIVLEKGVPLADVAELAGDTEDVVRKNYSRWVTSRQDRLTRILQEAFDDRPKPKIVAMPIPR